MKFLLITWASGRSSRRRRRWSVDLAAAWGDPLLPSDIAPVIRPLKGR